ncbi:MAG: hypothetical protein WCT40_00375 [Candidatus Magasanikbacteria bacterium]
MEHALRLHEFFVEGKNQQKSHVLLHITEPATDEERQRGYFFAVCEINGGDTKTILKLQEIIDQIENEYYEAVDSDNPDLLFEETISKINPAGFALLQDTISLSCVVGVINKSNIVFSFYGQPIMALFYKNKNGLYQKLNLIEGDADSGSNSLFAQVVQGKISPDDFLFVGTPHITQYFDLDRLEKIVTTRPARQSAEHLERVLSELKNGFSFGGLIINLFQSAKIVETAHYHKQNLPKGGSAKSLNSFFDTEKQTSSILSPSMMPKINDRLKGMFSGFSEVNRGTSKSNSTIAMRPPAAEINSAHARSHYSEKRNRQAFAQSLDGVVMARALKKSIALFGKILFYIIGFIWAVLLRLINTIGLLFLIVTNWQNRRGLILDNWRREWKNFVVYFKQLPSMTKIMLFSSIVIAIIFVLSVIYIRHQQTRAMARADFKTVFDQIVVKKDAGESALIYGDEITALSHIASAREQLEKLKCSDKDNIVDCNTMHKALDDIATRLRKIITVTPQILFDWNEASGKTNFEGLAKVGTKIIAYSHNTSTLFVYDALTKESKTVPGILPGIDGFRAAATPKENDYILFVFNKNQLAFFDPKEFSLRTATDAFADLNSDIKGIVIYNRRLYSLDPANNTIYRHDSVKGGFARGNNWLKDKSVDIKNGNSITIDGDLFVQKADGTIVKFNAGAMAQFFIQGIDPPLTNGNKIWTYTDLNYLYVLDTAGKRLIVLSKDGRLKNQLMAPELDNPSDTVIDEANGRAYILNNNKLYQINLK